MYFSMTMLIKGGIAMVVFINVTNNPQTMTYLSACKDKLLNGAN